VTYEHNTLHLGACLSAVAFVVGALPTGNPMVQGTPVADCDIVILSRVLNRSRSG
jgi:hypothetical protein